MRTEAFDPVTHLRTLLHEVWNDRAVGTIEKYYAEDVKVEAASGRRLRTTDELRTEVLERLGAFPDLAVTIEEMITVEDGDGYRSSIAYSATGTHNGPSKYGAASGSDSDYSRLLPPNAVTGGGVRR
ncbi:ester cyclase [Halobellus sp. EA9]|uniref:ester cyclase n=1 Tax=Halobellus sp. EA9 TaxID=3421647 RepID=UPI003EBCB54B